MADRDAARQQRNKLSEQFGADDRVLSMGLKHQGEDWGVVVHLSEPMAELPDVSGGVPVSHRFPGSVTAQGEQEPAASLPPARAGHGFPNSPTPSGAAAPAAADGPAPHAGAQTVAGGPAAPRSPAPEGPHPGGGSSAPLRG